MLESPPSAVRLRLIGRVLREVRGRLDITLHTAGCRLERSAASLSAIENGRQSLRRRDLLFILDAYRIDDPWLREGLLTLAEQQRERGWWREFTDVISPADLDYASLERDASRLESVETRFVPGLLQTEEYARAIMRASLAESRLHKADRLVAYRMARQRILNAPDPPTLHVVVDEAALRRVRGGPTVMRDQLRGLLEASEREHVTVQVLPLRCAADPGLNETFMLLEIGRPAILRTVLISLLGGRLNLDTKADLVRYREAFQRARSVALPESASRELIHDVLSEL